MDKVVVICVRDPDAANEFEVYGDIELKIVDVDLGAMNLRNDDEWASWRESQEAEVAALRELGRDDAAGRLEEIIAEAAESFGHAEIAA